MSFSIDVKREICAHEIHKKCCAVATSYGIACFGKYFDSRGLIFHTEQAFIAQYAKHAFEQIGVFGKIYVKGGGEKRLYEYAIKEPEQVKKMLHIFGHTGEEPSVRLNKHNLRCAECASHFIAAAFLCCGTSSNPEKEYNLEFVCSRHNLIKDFETFLKQQTFLPKYTLRKGNHVIYFKASEQIEDILTTMGATNSSLQIMKLKVFKDFRNKANRITNCETANIDKIIEATQVTVQAIGYLISKDALAALPENLQQVALLRMENQDISLSELAKMVQPPISKSGLSHRLKKIETIAATMREKEKNE
ncbi:MAG: DNA-binding protein WhiA [Oscillospiraceae bacterium]|nr:DNA-binding protein WhiA [Oscillospiraceae bacterium]